MVTGSTTGRCSCSALWVSLICASSAQTCMSQNFTNKIFETCIDLPVLNAFLHWKYSPSNGTVDVAY
ncbi:Cytochrome b561 and DOMON domain-containing protein [Nymphaea thermarum]|nr:Cytochrome b561 and DOMON domain-containing protein [Nymphaea thermarum]